MKRVNEKSTEVSVDFLRQNLVQHDLQMKALIQDILVCKRSMTELNHLNTLGRTKLAELRKDIESLDQLAKDHCSVKLMSEAESHRLQLSNSLQAFKNANITSAFAIQKVQTEELFNTNTSDPEVRQRKKTDKSSLIKLSSGVTDQLLSISRQLAETTQRSAETLDSLVTSSTNVHSTKDELESTAGTISQSGKLLKKYGRREFTDKLVIVFAFIFFAVVVLYILNKRLI
ncbi:vesicle transport protein Sec20 [Arctopsyche grandis]|uniref:vesicle transport protein Sec20 n=1 Tax=Arctopsyche grandis TaxID=121162 RepID=UPI00406D9256